MPQGFPEIEGTSAKPPASGQAGPHDRSSRPAARVTPILTILLAILISPSVGAGSTSIVPVDPRFRVVNELDPPAGVTQPLGDLAFSGDGATAYFISNTESPASAVWSAAVVRNASGDVVGFQNAVRELEIEDLDTGLAFAPGSTTLFYRLTNAIGHHPPGGPAQAHPINYGVFGGLAFLPAGSTHAGSLISTSHSAEAIYLHSVSDDHDGTYTVGPASLYADLDGVDPGDLEVATRGLLAGSALVADYASSTPVVSFPLDPVTGLPQEGTSPTLLPFATASGLVLTWGLAIDPVTDNIWILLYAGSGPLMIQIERAALFEDGFESGDTTAWRATG
jgi:hypothetical protein